MEFYRQCKLRSNNTELTCWIEERGARVGWLITLEDYPGQTWKVIDVYTRLSKEDALDRERDYMKQRRASDIKSGSREKF